MGENIEGKKYIGEEYLGEKSEKPVEEASLGEKKYKCQNLVNALMCRLAGNQVSSWHLKRY